MILNFLELNLSPEDLKAYQENRQAFPIKTWKAFLVEKMKQYKLTLSFPEDTSMIDNNLGLLESFYEIGLKRDDALVKNALSKINDEHVDVAVLIAGGFHTNQITRLLREKNYSYMVVAPKITQASNLELYHEILKEKARPAAPADENLRQVPAIQREVVSAFRKETKDGGYKIFGDPKLVTIQEGAQIDGGVVLDVSEGKGQIIVLKGARLTGTTYLKASKDNSVVIEKDAIVDSSYLEGVTVGEDAVVRHSVLVTALGSIDAPESWQFDTEGKFKVSGSRTRIGAHATVDGYTVIVNSAVGEGTKIEGGVYKESNIGPSNRLSHTKMTLVHTEKDVTLQGSDRLPLEVSEAWLGYGFYSDQQAFIDSALHPNQILSLRFDGTTETLHGYKAFMLPQLSFVGLAVPKIRGGRFFNDR